MLFPVAWARLQGIDFDQMFDVWTESDFFQFFHVKQSTQSVVDGIHKCGFSVGPFKQEILLEVIFLASGKIIAASLFVDAAWQEPCHDVRTASGRRRIRALGPGDLESFRPQVPDSFEELHPA
jgi:hypothetical protein